MKTIYIIVAVILCFLVVPFANAGTVNYTYDDAGRLIQVEYENGKVITYTYDNAGNLLQRQITEGEPDPSGVVAGDSDGFCFIATAAYGSYTEPQVQLLRQFRDRYLLTNRAGRAFVNLYYKCSPPIADFIIKHDTLRAVVRWGLLPVLGVSWVTLNLGPVPDLILIFLFGFFLISLVVCRRGLRKR